MHAVCTETKMFLDPFPLHISGHPESAVKGHRMRASLRRQMHGGSAVTCTLHVALPIMAHSVYPHKIGCFLWQD